MTDRKEIEQKSRNFPGSKTEQLILEVLLDIRDLLTKKSK